ncbi:MAG: hypothetical protein IJW86_08800 [Clostridia bacterium]|nr:hypothetical protein [Clostridia bacterium]
MSKFRWIKMDTASIMFTCLSSKKWGRSFRMAAVFKDEEIDPVLLKKAASDIVSRYPSTHSFLRKGFFWNYQECTSKLPEIREEFSRPLLPIAMRDDGRPDFRIVYHKRRLALETAHHIGDGKGVTEYFDALLERYVELTNDPDAPYNPPPFDKEEISNAFQTYYQKGGEKAEKDDTTAYKLPGEIEKDFLQLIFAMISVDEIRKAAKEKDMTVTEFLAAALILGAIKNAKAPINEVICIGIPVNLRRFFPTKSIRNFTIQTKIDFHPQGRTDWTFSEVCSSVRGQLKKRLEISELQKQLNKFGGLVNNPVIKIVPNFIKLPVIRMMQHSSHSANTTILTNTGESELSDALKEKIERVDGVNGDTSGYGLISTCSAVSVNGFFSLCFSILSHDTSWAKECIRILAGQGLNIRVESTHGNGETD